MTRAKTIREAVHGDIELLSHELDVVNTAIFQRLHGVKQLGMAHVVYPTATHTRFEHSLGCVHVSQRIIDQLNRVGSEQVNDGTRLKIRMAALLHDLAHVPYGHTLENELRVIEERHDESEARLSRFFERLKSEVEADQSKDCDMILPLIESAKDVILAIKRLDYYIKRREDPDPATVPLPIEEWFVADIIGNTICADLLDYARRDMRATGLNQDYDDRLYAYFCLAEDETGATRLALRTTKQQGLRLDAVSEILHVLRIRYTLSERVLFHHTKNIASAMLGEAVHLAKPGAEAFDDLRDDQILPYLRTCVTGMDQPTREAVRTVVANLEARHLHKMVFRVNNTQQAPYQLEHSEHLGSDYSEPEKRAQLQAEICQKIPSLNLGDVLIYSPEPHMTMKEVWVNVLVRKGDETCRPLRQEANDEDPYLPPVVADEVKALEAKYNALWTWSVSLARDKLQYCFAVQTFIRQTLNISNDPFLQGYLDRHPDLQDSREVRDRAQGDYAVQAEAVRLIVEEDALSAVAAAGPPDRATLMDGVVRRARANLYGTDQAIT